MEAMKVVTATKKPIDITAVLWDGSQSEAGNIIDWVVDQGGAARYKEANEAPDHKPRIEVQTIDAWAVLHTGDWMLRGVKGEFYPIKPDIFDQTYDYPTHQ